MRVLKWICHFWWLWSCVILHHFDFFVNPEKTYYLCFSLEGLCITNCMESKPLVDMRRKVILLKLGPNIRKLIHPIDRFDFLASKQKEQLHSHELLDLSMVISISVLIKLLIHSNATL